MLPCFLGLCYNACIGSKQVLRKGNEMKKSKRVYVQVFKLSATGRKVAKMFEDTIGQDGNVSYAEWKEIRNVYTKHYGKSGVEFAIVIK